MKTVLRTARTLSLVLPAVVLSAHRANAQTVGPDMISSSHVDVARNGVDAAGTTTAYSIGAATCNRGDLPAITNPQGNLLLRPLIAQNMYRLKAAPGGQYQRFEQVGQGWAKRVAGPVQGSSPTCGTCTQGPSGTMGVGCADIYSSGFNGLQTLLGPRSAINPVLGSSTVLGGGGVGDAVTKQRVQVPTADVVGQPAGTRFFVETVHMLPDDAQYLRPGQTVAINAMNNAASQEININNGTSNPTLLGAGNAQIPALVRWQMIDPAVTIAIIDDDSTPNPRQSGTFIRTRFYVASRITDLANGTWRYEYAIYNLNSDRSAGSFTLPLPGHVPMTDFTFHHPLSHSGEPYSNAVWTATRSGDSLTVSTQPYAVNINANAVRWGTMYNFGFTTPRAPTAGDAQLGLFKPGPTSSLAVPGITVPTPVHYCDADFDNDGIWAGDGDIEAFFACLSGNCCTRCGSPDFNGDGDSATDTDIESFFRVLAGGSC